MELNKIYNENCLDTMLRMPDNFIDLTVTSPPYDNLRNYEGYSFDFESVAESLYRVTKKGGVVIWVVNDATINGSETGTSFRQALYFREIGFNLHDTMIFIKRNCSPQNNNRYEPVFEYMFVFSEGKPKNFNPIMERKIWQEKLRVKTCNRKQNGKKVMGKSGKSNYKVKSNVWRYNTGKHHATQDAIAFNHPAIFPEQLALDHIKSWSNPGDLVYDPFVGSGTTAICAIKLKRQWIGSEISQKYANDIAQKRIDTMSMQPTLF